MRTRWLGAVGLIVVAMASPGRRAVAEDWPQWRGPSLNGVSAAQSVPLEWSEDENVRWKLELPAFAGSTPVVWGDSVFLTSPDARKEGEEAKVGRRFRRSALSDGGGEDIHLYRVARKDGKLLWKKPVSDGNQLFGKHNMASPSPVTDGELVIAMTGTGTITAFDYAGNRRWRRSLAEENGDFGLYWGYGSSPLLHGDHVIVQVLHGATTKKPSYVVAIQKKTGKTAWKVERKTDAVAECPDAYTTPSVLVRDGQEEIVISGADYVTGHDPGSGKELWRVAGLNPQKARNYRVCGSPVVFGDMIFAPSRRKPLLGLKATTSGDRTAPETVWAYGKGPDVPTPVCDGERLYVIDDMGIATCLDARSGDVVWGPERIARGTYSASPILAGGRVYVTNEDCVTTVLAADKEFEILATNELDGGYTLSSLAVAGSEIFLRAGNALYCLGES